MKRKESRAAHKPSDFSLGQIYEFCAEFGRQGGSPELIQNLIENKEKMTKVVSLAQKTETRQNHWWIAKVILGKNFISPEEISNNFNIFYSNSSIEYLKKTLPDEETLRRFHYDNYILIPGPPNHLNLLQIEKIQEKIKIGEKNEPWFVAHHEEHFAKKEVVIFCKWIAVKKEPQFFYKTWDEQQKLISKTDYVPNVATIAYTYINYYMARGIRLLNDCYVRTSTVSSIDGRGVIAGYFYNTLSFDRAWQGDLRKNIGIVSAYSFQSNLNL